MAKVQIVNVEVLDNPSLFFNPFQFQITFDCIENLSDDLEWKIIYVGSAESEQHDQELDSVLVGPVPSGRHKFVFQADPPKTELIPVQDAVGVTVVIITCTYHSKEFIRVGYYVNNEYDDLELRENPPESPDFSKLTRNILDSKPRVTRFKINWDNNDEELVADENIPPDTDFANSLNHDNSSALSSCNSKAPFGQISGNVAGEVTSNDKFCNPPYENSTDSMDMRMFVE
uniref:histone chaperone ASF1B-like n=1 Tax=Styela clava TaxID=7725 RepID=UPI001939DC6F|nr:histone chaperone ASF1B-like [Styela clava]